MDDLKPVRDYWTTSIVDIKPGEWSLRGYPVEQLAGNLTFVQTIWLTLRGEIPDQRQAELLEAAMVASVDGGPMSPSCAIASMAATCGVGLNSAVASGINALGDTHGGAGQQCMEMFYWINSRVTQGMDLDKSIAEEIDGLKFVPGFGHRFHPIDPRAVRLLELVTRARDAKSIDGKYLNMANRIEALLEKRKGKVIPLNIDGASAVIFSELGFPPPLGRGLFILARSVGLLAHAWEQTLEGKRIKGPVPPEVSYTYTGPARRELDAKYKRSGA